MVLKEKINTDRESMPLYVPLSEENEALVRRIAESTERLNISLTNDFAFKTVFQNKLVLKGLLSAMLELPAKEILDIELQNTFLPGEYADDKTGILDIRIYLNGNQKINIEMQVLPFPFWEERSLYYLFRMFIGDLKRGMDYDTLEKSIHISILKYTLFESDDFYSVIEFMDKKTGRVYSDKVSLRVLQLNQLEKATEAEKETDLYLWAKMLSADDWEELEMLSEKNEYIAEAVNELEKINSDSKKRYEYLCREMKERDESTIRNYFTKKGKTEGKTEGKAESVLELLTELGPVPEELRSTVLNQKDDETLKRWLKLAAKADSIEEFCGKL